MTLSAGSANRSDVSGELVITNPEILPMKEMIATYSAEQDLWTVTGGDLKPRFAVRAKLPGRALCSGFRRSCNR